jgi:nickel/cobalt transporter (NicO) family protein
MGFGYLMALAVLLGFFHALGPGHAKVILGSLMLDSHMSYMRGIRFALVFSVTHIIDILFLFLLIRLIGNWIDMSRILSILQIVSPVLLFTLSSILLIQMVRSH